MERLVSHVLTYVYSKSVALPIQLGNVSPAHKRPTGDGNLFTTVVASSMVLCLGKQ
jgi:hypothetical protein